MSLTLSPLKPLYDGHSSGSFQKIRCARCVGASRAPPPSLKEVGNQAYPQFCFDLLRNSITNIIHSMWVLANSDEYHLLKWVLASQSIQRVQNSHVVQLSGCDQSP